MQFHTYKLHTKIDHNQLKYPKLKLPIGFNYKR